MEEKNIISKHVFGNRIDQHRVAESVVLEEYRSLIRLAQALNKHKLDSIVIETPLGDFHYSTKGFDRAYNLKDNSNNNE